MKKITLFLAGVIILSGLATITVSCENISFEKTTLHFSNLQIKENKEEITVELNGTNTVFLKKDHYIVPTRIETFTFPLGTEIKNVRCTPKNILRQQLTKELMITPEPVLAGETSITVNNGKPENPLSVNTWYTYDVGCGVTGNQRGVIVKVEVFPIQYYPSEDFIYWADTIDIEI